MGAALLRPSLPRRTLLLALLFPPSHGRKNKTGGAISAAGKNLRRYIVTSLLPYFAFSYSVYTLVTRALTAHIKSEVTVPIPRATPFVGSTCSPSEP